MQVSQTARSVGLALLMVVMGTGSVLGAPAGTHIGGFWPAGLATGLLLYAGQRLLPWTTLAVVALALTTYVVGGLPVATGLLFAVAVALEALVVERALRHGLGGELRLRDNRDLARYSAAALLGASVGAVGFAGASWAADFGSPLAVALAAFLCHLVSQLILVAFFVRTDATVPEAGPGERTVLWILTVVVSIAAFVPRSLLVLVFLVLPLVGWAALRTRLRETLWLLILVGVVAQTAYAYKAGPFTGLHVLDQSSPELASLALQAYLLACTLAGIPFALAVTRQRYAAGEVERERTRLRRIVEGASRVAIIETDRHGRITLFNPGAEELLGWSEEEVLGRYPTLFHDRDEIVRQARDLGVEPDFRQVSLAIASPSVGRRDWTYRHRDGSSRDVSVYVVEILDPTGDLLGYLCTAEDVTDRVRTQRALEAALLTERLAVSRLTEVDRTKDAFVSSVSHELRTPITSIVGYLELLLDGAYGETTPSQHEALGRIDANSQRLLELIDDLLTLSSIESLDVQLERRPVDLREVLRTSAARALPAADQRGQQLVLDVPETPVVVHGDLAHLERMVSNLVGNAVKFTPEGGTITLRAARTPEKVGFLEVEDTGVGIPAEEQAHLFNRFHRASYAQDEAVKGSGLGLAIARSIAQRHGARISATSAPGQGSVFRVRFEDSGHQALQPL